MPQDYQSNSNKLKEQKTQEPKKIEKVVVNEVIMKKKSVGRKFRDLLAEKDLRGVVYYVIHEVLIPSAKNMAVDAVIEGAKRTAYGDRAIRNQQYGPAPQFDYRSASNPINPAYRRNPRDPRYAPQRDMTSHRGRLRQSEYVLATREEAQRVLDRMNDIIEKYETVSLADLNEMLGFEKDFTDNTWGWVNLLDVPILQVQNGFLIDLPLAEPLRHQ